VKCNEEVYTEKDAIRLNLQVKPHSSQNQFVGVMNAKLKVAIAAPPVDDKANLELIKFIAKALKLKRRDISIICGTHSGNKVLELPLAAKSALDKLIASLS
jgi:uncharacterized protein